MDATATTGRGKTANGGGEVLRRAYRYRLYPSAEQAETLERHLELCRRVYNKALWWRQGAWDREKRSVGFAEQRRALAPLRADEEAYRAISGGILEETVKRVDRAYRAFFRRIRAGGAPGYPRAKGPGQYRSFEIPRGRDFRLEWDGGQRFGRLSFKGVAGLKVRMHRPLPDGANARRLIIKREPDGRWYAVVGWDIEGYQPALHPNPAAEVGLHLGLVDYVTTDAGERFDGPGDPDGGRRVRRARRRVSRKQKGSRRRERARRLAAREHARARARRRNFRHKLSRDLVGRYGRIAVGVFGVKTLLRRNKRDPERPAALNARIRDAGWSELVFMLRYKAESAGGVCVEVESAGIVHECSRCGFGVDKDLRERRHACPRCGLSVPRGVNAARNALKRAAPALRGGERVAAPDEPRTAAPGPAAATRTASRR